MSPVSILRIRGQIQGLLKADCEKLAVRILRLNTARDIEEALKNINEP
ncbi:hypothetical protein [Anaerocolumna sp. MB42-C2]|nr:hypothetical protein [Anaerocolumna sp. MB42-C2]WMJ86419.1 hypothetical protein RBU59_20590 [Anaerocolumna sp. MB42-C2]